MFADTLVRTDVVTMDSINWWSTYGLETPNLADVAKRAGKSLIALIIFPSVAYANTSHHILVILQLLPLPPHHEKMKHYY